MKYSIHFLFEDEDSKSLCGLTACCWMLLNFFLGVVSKEIYRGSLENEEGEEGA